jgi:hypothetical protein
MIDLRLRLNTRLLKTVERFDSRTPAVMTAAGPASDVDEQDASDASFVEEIAHRHQRESIDLITPSEFDPATFLSSIADTSDPKVTIDEQIRAHTILTRWRAGRATFCACFSTRAARDGAEFRAWIDELHEAGFLPEEGDPEIARRVRALARGERLEPQMMYVKTSAALEAVIAAAVERTASTERNATQAPTEKTATREARLWRTMLSADPQVPIRLRLKAFEALEKASAFRACTCGGPEPKRQLQEEKFDSALAYLVRLVAGRHYRSAVKAVEYPETYLAVRDAIDTAIRSQQDTTAE